MNRQRIPRANERGCTLSVNQTQNRRPLKVRDARLAQRFAQWLCRMNVSPNLISIASVVFAALAAFCLIASGRADSTAGWVLAVLAAFLIQGRLLCNLFDGMVVYWSSDFCASPIQSQHAVNSRVIVDLKLLALRTYDGRPR